MSDYAAWFNSVDKDGSGGLSYSELYDYLTAHRGYTQAQVEEMFDAADKSQDGQITLDEYLDLMKNTKPIVHKESALRSMCRAFDTDGNGTIDKSELKAVFDSDNRGLSESDVERIIKMTDTDGDGKIDYNELCMKVFGQSCD